MRDSASPANPKKRAAKLGANRPQRAGWAIAIVLLVVLSDQITKALAAGNLADGVPVKVIGEFLMLTLVYNRGGAMGTDFGSSNYYLISSVLVLGLVLYYAYANLSNGRLFVPLACVAGGAIGNIIDRLRLGMVVDFLDVDFFDVNIFGLHIERWWTFNVADAAITCGIAALIIQFIFAPKRSHSQLEGAGGN